MVTSMKISELTHTKLTILAARWTVKTKRKWTLSETIEKLIDQEEEKSNDGN